ncbi:DUF5359 family protein [Bacillus cereus]
MERIFIRILIIQFICLCGVNYYLY